ncbi:hypothetical protein KM043_006263 [Ampulex compressa]|nr:hypothetical protein KM043_006263 [Ampulex compressa]
MAKIKKMKISKVKRNNQRRAKLTKQGKLKMRRHRQSKKQIQKLPPPQTKVVEEEEEEEESDHGEDLMNMVEEDDLNFLQKAISNKSYNILKQIRLDETDKIRRPKRSKKKDDLLIEEMYENVTSKINAEESGKKVRMLLPIKTKNGVIEKRVIEEENGEVSDCESTKSEGERANDEIENSDMEIERDLCNVEKEDHRPVSAIELLACREDVLRTKRLKIGILSSGLLENPEQKCGNFKALLDLMEESNPEVYITVRKLATVSLMEIFKDILPSYNILQIKPDGVKLKKDTLQLYNYEAILLRSYKSYLQKLEKMSAILKRKKGDTRTVNEQELQLGELAINCMCELLVNHLYFNFSTNIANYLVPLLNNKRANVRETVAKCISQIFKEDKRAELSLHIVRGLNKFIKLKSHSVNTEVLSVLLFLRIKDVNLDQEKEEESKQKKLMSHKQRILALSKRERKKGKKLEEVERELLETKAEENKQSKQKLLTEITSVVFTIYFRIIKQAPNSKILTVCLEGLAKFAHCINLDFYQDLVTVIDKLMDDRNLGLREQLHCVECVFTILSGQGSTLNIDPYRFYVHLYKNLLHVHCGKTHMETEIVIKTLIQVLINRRKRITNSRLLAFVKRMAILALQSHHNGVLGLLGIIKQIMQLGKTANILLDTDSSTGDGVYQPELEEPEHCNASCTALWELVALQRHYHSVVQKMAKNLAWEVPITGEGSVSPEITKLTPQELYQEFDPSRVAFKPSIPMPKKVKKVSNNIANHYFANSKFEEYLNETNDVELFACGYVDFYKELKSALHNVYTEN